MSTLKTDNIESLDTGRVIEVDSLSDRQDLANDASGSGASLVSMEGGPSVEVAMLDRVIRVTSIADRDAITGPTGAMVVVGENRYILNGLGEWELPTIIHLAASEVTAARINEISQENTGLTEIRLPSGSYNISERLDLLSNLTIKGAGQEETKLVWTGGYNIKFTLENTGVTNTHLKDLTIQGGAVSGVYDDASREFLVANWVDCSFTRVKFDTFILSGLGIRRDGGTDWIVGGVYNSVASVEALESLNSRNIDVISCAFENISASAGIQIFGGSYIYIEKTSFINTGSVNVLMDDASTVTQLKQYCVNKELHISRCTGDGKADIGYSASSTCRDSKFEKINARSYDFDQQLGTLPSSVGYAGVPFLWQNYIDRGQIFIDNCVASEIEIRGYAGFSKLTNNLVLSASDNAVLLGFNNNSILWPDGNTYHDNVDDTAVPLMSVVADNNTLICDNTGVIAFGYENVNCPAFVAVLTNTHLEERSVPFSQVARPFNNRAWSYEYTLNRDKVAVERSTLTLKTEQGLTVEDTAGVPYSTSLRVTGNSAAWTANTNDDFTGGKDPSLYALGVYASSNSARFNFSISSGLGTTSVPRVSIDRTSLRPSVDTGVSLGTASERYSEVFSAAGTINTSDEREKTEIIELSEAEKATAIACKKLLGKYKFKAAVEEKGDKARWHFGAGAQSVNAAFEDNGLNGFEYGVLCYDKWEADEETEKPAGNRYGIRYDELLAFVLSVS